MDHVRIASCLLLSLLAVAASASGAQEPGQAPYVIIHCGTLLDVPGRPARLRASVVVAEGRIRQVLDGHAGAAALGLPAGATVTVIDLSDRFVLPGLIDCHTHITGQYSRDARLDRVTQSDADAALKGAVFAERTLMAGFTTIRDVGSVGDAAFALRDAIEQGLLPGPRMLVAGESISPTGGHSDATLGYRDELFAVPSAMQGIADGPDACRQAVRAQVKRGADVIKLTATGGVLSNTAAGVEQQFFTDELEAIVEAAHLLGRKVAAHAHGTSGIKAALRAGVDSIEHGTFLDEECIALFKESGAFLVPTIHAGKFVEQKAREEGYFPLAVRRKAAEVGPVIQGAFGKAHAAGVRIAFGTDAGVGEHGTNALEFTYMAEAGMSPMDALVSATVNAAELCGRGGEIGTIEAGKRADIIAVTGSPLDDVAVLRDVRFVMKDGRVYRFNQWPQPAWDAGGGAVKKSVPALLPLRCGVQHYAWGDVEFIPALLGIDNRERKPFAELWMGAHPDLPAAAEIDGRTVRLDELIAGAPQAVLGARVAGEYGQLPYLLKVLAAAAPLSIQAHPSREAARTGFAREEAAGIPRDAPHRNYRDENHKPELILALSEFRAVQGFRPPGEIAAALRAVPELRALAPLFNPADPGYLRDLYGLLMTIPHAGLRLDKLLHRLEEENARRPFGPDEREHWILRAGRACACGPHDEPDRGLVAIYLLNLVRLAPGEAMYLPAGVLHAYLEGWGLEIMANSNNVLRGGLTAKHVDVPELLRNLRFEGGPAEVIRAEGLEGRREWVYRTPAREFELRRVDVGPGRPWAVGADHSADILVLTDAVGDATVTVSSGTEATELRPGRPCLVIAAAPYEIAATAAATIFRATVPCQDRA